MAQDKPKHENATTYAISGQDFGDPKLKKYGMSRPKEIRFSEHSNCIICKKCGKRNYIPMAPIEYTHDLLCKCGHKIAVLAGKDYSDILRKANQTKALQAAVDKLAGIEEIPSQII